jgi:hypothetical protein
MVIIWLLYGYYMVLIWFLYGSYMVIIWFLYGYYMVIIWLMMVNNLDGGIPTPLKNDGVRQLGWWNSQLNGKIKNDPNHQPVYHVFQIVLRFVHDLLFFYVFTRCRIFTNVSTVFCVRVSKLFKRFARLFAPKKHCVLTPFCIQKHD